MKYRFRATRTFWRSFGKLRAEQQDHTRKASAVFMINPFDPGLRSHKIKKLSARYGRIIHPVEIERDLRAVFYIDGDVVVTIDIGSHDIYRG